MVHIGRISYVTEARTNLISFILFEDPFLKSSFKPLHDKFRMLRASEEPTIYRSFLHFPKEILLYIFGLFANTVSATTPWKYNKFFNEDSWTTLRDCRLVCRVFNAHVSPLLCPVLRVSLCPHSLSRLANLSENHLIASGVRGITFDLRCHSSYYAQGHQQYYQYARKVLQTALSRCSWFTEFADYAEDDQSDAAVRARLYSKAESKFGRILRCWHENTMRSDDSLAAVANQDNVEDTEIDAERWCTFLGKCYNVYAARHMQEIEMIRNGSFVRIVAQILLRFARSPFVWFKDEYPDGRSPYGDALELSNKDNTLACVLQDGHAWLDIEMLPKSRDENVTIHPLRLLTELPMTCYAMGRALRGLQIDCFPLIKGFDGLVPIGIKPDVHWNRFALVCHELTVFHFGYRGMNHTPYRTKRHDKADMAMINAFLKAACAGSKLQRVYLSMTPFRVCNNPSEIELAYCSGPILTTLSSPALRSVTIHTIDISEQDLFVMVNNLPPTLLKDLCLSSITLSEGFYAETMEILKRIDLSRLQHGKQKLKIILSTLQGGEFGPPTRFVNDDDLLWGTEEERDIALQNLREHSEPVLLKQVLRWLHSDQEGLQNPLVGSTNTEEKQD